MNSRISSIWIPYELMIGLRFTPYFLVLIQESKQRKSRKSDASTHNASTPSPDFQAYPLLKRYVHHNLAITH